MLRAVKVFESSSSRAHQVGIRATLMTALLAVGCATTSGPGQRADLEFRPPIIDPAFATGAGPVVLIDEAHYNFHTAEGRYKPFAELLRRDGYIVRSSASAFTEQSLAGARVLVISNALNKDDADDWVLPNPSAFDASEISAIEAWVERGGSLLMIADHMPFPGAAEELADRFGLLFINGYARNAGGGGGRMVFSRADGSLRAHPITNGRSPAEGVETVMAFTGQAFRARPGTPIEPLLVLGDDAVILLPQVAAEFTDTTPQLAAVGWFQGVVLHHGSGRVAAFGEAAMFSAQVSGVGRFPMGMNDPAAGENYQFLLNVMHWLTGQLD